MSDPYAPEPRPGDEAAHPETEQHPDGDRAPAADRPQDADASTAPAAPIAFGASDAAGDPAHDAAPDGPARPVAPAQAGPPPWTGVLGSHPAAPPRAPRARPSGWVWPAVSALALVVGLLGGVGGAVAYEQWSQDRTLAAGGVPDGLAGVETVDLAPLPVDDGTVAAVARELLPRTVQIAADLDGEAGGATGSGFLLDRQGHVVTNNHVVADAAAADGEISVVDRAGTRLPATVVGRSAVYDLAILAVEDLVGREPAALGDSSALRVGETVVAIGSPLGLSSTVTSGIVSALQRPVTTGGAADESSFINAVQTDAAINPGNSGGPLVDLRGRVVGVNSAIATTGGNALGAGAGNIGVGFAIPIEQVKVTADQILRTGQASYPVIGAQVRTGTQARDGAVILDVTPGSPADDAGLEPDDVVVAVDGERVTDGIAMIVAIRAHQPGDRVEFTVQRGEDRGDLAVVLGAETG